MRSSPQSGLHMTCKLSVICSVVGQSNRFCDCRLNCIKRRQSNTLRMRNAWSNCCPRQQRWVGAKRLLLGRANMTTSLCSLEAAVYLLPLDSQNLSSDRKPLMTGSSPKRSFIRCQRAATQQTTTLSAQVDTHSFDLAYQRADNSNA